MNGTLPSSTPTGIPRILVAGGSPRASSIADALRGGPLQQTANLSEAETLCAGVVPPPLVLVLDRSAATESAKDFERRRVAPLVHLHAVALTTMELPSYGLEELLEAPAEFERFAKRVHLDWLHAEEEGGELYRFTRDAMHELRTSLATVLGFSGLLDDGVAGELEPGQKDYLAYVSRGAKTLLQGLEVFQESLRLRFGTWPEHRGRLVLAELLGDAMPDDVPADLEELEVEGHPEQLPRAIELLVVRARKGDDGSSPPVRLRLRGEELELRIPSVREPHAEERRVLVEGILLDRFEGSHSIERVAGIGLGLARRLLDRAGGRVEWTPDGEEPALLVRLPVIRQLAYRGLSGGSSSGISKS